MTETTPAPHWATIYCSSAIFLFALLALIMPSGYSIGAVLLLLGGIYAYLQDKQHPLNRRDLYLLLVLVAFTLEGIINNVWHGLSSSHYDKTLRFLLAIPAFYLVRWSQPKINWAWVGLALGSLGAFALAAYERFFILISRPGGFNHPIQFGNLSMLMGLFCLAGLGWAANLARPKQRRLYLFILLLGAIGGILGSLLSGSRGGWIGLPFVFFVLYKAYHNYFPLRSKLIVISALILSAVAVYHIPQTHVKERVNAAFNDIEQYQQGNSHTSLGARFEMWQGAIKTTKEKPLLGWGKEEYQPAMQQLVKENKIAVSGGLFNHAHNEILDKAAKNGLVGLLALLALYIVPIWYFSPYLKHTHLPTRSIAVAGTLLPVAYIDFGLTQAFLSHNSGVMVYAFWLMIWAGYLRNTIGAYQLSNTAPAATAP